MAILIKVGYVMDGASTAQLAGFVSKSTRAGVVSGTKAAAPAVASTFGKFWGRALNIGMGIFIANATRALGAAFTKIFTAPLEAGAEFQKSLAKLGTLFPEAARNGQEFADQLLSMDKRLGSTAELAEGLFVIIQSGVRDTSAAFKILEASATLATTGFIDQATAAKAVTGIMLAFSESGLTAADAATQLFQGFTLAKTGFAEFVRGIGPILPQMKLAGVGMKDMIATFILLTRQGVPAAQAFTFIKNTLLKLIKPTNEAAKNFKLLFGEFGGISERNLKEVIAHFGGFGNFLIEVGKRAKAADIPISGLFTRLRSMPLPLTLAADGAKKLAQAYSDLDTVVFSMDVQLKTATDTLEDQWDVALRNVTDILAGPALEGVNRLTESFIKLNETLADPQVRESLGYMVSIFTIGLADTMEMVGRAIGFIAVKIRDAVQEIKFLKGAMEAGILGFGVQVGEVEPPGPKPKPGMGSIILANLMNYVEGLPGGGTTPGLGTGPPAPPAPPAPPEFDPGPAYPVQLGALNNMSLQFKLQKEMLAIEEQRVMKQAKINLARKMSNDLIAVTLDNTSAVVVEMDKLDDIAGQFLNEMQAASDIEIGNIAASWGGAFEQVSAELDGMIAAFEKGKANGSEAGEKIKLGMFKAAAGVIKVATAAGQITDAFRQAGIEVPAIVDTLINSAMSIGEGLAQLATGNIVSGVINIATGIVGAIAGIFGGPSKAAIQMQKQISETFGEISIELAEQIVKVSQAGEGWKRLGLILREVEVSADNVVAVTDLTNHVFQQVTEGTIEASEAMGDLQTAVVAIGPHFAALLEQAPAAFRELAKNIREAGLETQEFTQFTSELAQAFLPDLKQALEGAMGPGQFEFFATTAVVALEQMIAGGMSVVEAFRMMGDELTRLGELSEQFPDRAPGLELITSLNAFINENPQLMNRLQALGSGMEFLANVGRVTADTFANWQNQLVNTSNAMQQQGASMEQVIVLMGPQLGLARELAGTYNYSLNPGISRLISEGDRLGMSMQRQKPIMTQIRDLLQQLVNATVGFTASTTTASSSVGRLAGRAQSAAGSARSLAHALGNVAHANRSIGNLGARFQGGGVVSAQGGVTVPAMLHPGETVLTSDATQRRGRENIQAVGGASGAPIVIEIIMPDGRKMLELDLERVTRSGKTRIDLNSLPVEVG